jgi:hypothetical protein
MDNVKVILVFPTPADTNVGLLKQINQLVTTSAGNISMISYGDIVPEQYNNSQNKYLHFMSVVTALSLCTTEFVIKHRSDEFYTELTPFFSAVKSNPKKITTTEVFFRNSASFLFHPSDHLVGGSCDNLKKVFGQALEYLQYPIDKIDHSLFKKLKTTEYFSKYKSIVAEQFLGVAAVTALRKDHSFEEPIDCVSLMRETFHIVKCDELGFFRVAYNSAKSGPLEYFDNTYYNPQTDVSDIRLYE